MKILLTGATGFIGAHLARALGAAGHELVCAVRDPARAAGRLPPGASSVSIDFARATTPVDWRATVAGIDVAINAVGILRETASQRFDALHRLAPCALFTACAESGVRRVVQVSALGADEAAQSGYHLSKKAADDCLAALPIESAIVQPSLVYGPGGTSARLFSAMARLPVIPLPGDGRQQVQPVYVDDLIDAIVALVERDELPVGRIPLVGPQPLSLRDFYARLRAAMGVRTPARFLPVPMAFMRVAAGIGSHVPGVLLDADTLAMLNRGNTGDPAPIATLLGRQPRTVEQFLVEGRKG